MLLYNIIHDCWLKQTLNNINYQYLVIATGHCHLVITKSIPLEGISLATDPSVTAAAAAAAAAA